jgi:uncharacterized protein (DUF1684 family)
MKNGIFVALCMLFIHTLPGQDSFKDITEKYRDNHYHTFASQEEGPITISDIKHLDFYEPDKAYLCDCKVLLTPDAKPFQLKTYSNIEKPYQKYAQLECVLKGEKLQLSAYVGLLHRNNPVYKDRLFVPFMDLTNGEETYGGGRYLDMSKNDIKGKMVVVDFNKAYNPWCAYSEGYNCPIPPLENHLEIAIEAGEKNFKGVIKVK